MKRFGALLAAALLVLSGTATPGAAQRYDDDDEDDGRAPGVTLELFGGAADFGRILEQVAVADVTTVDGVIVIGDRVQRELTAGTAFTFGGSVGVWLWDETGARLGLTWAPTELEFDDDTPLNDDDLLDVDDVADLGVLVLSLDVLQYLVDPDENTVAPYANAGFAATWWDLDEEDDDEDDAEAILGDDDSEFRWGGLGGIGIQVGLADKWALRAEATTFALGNPFDGDDAFDVANPAFVTFDEPSTVRMTRFSLALTYNFMRGEPLFGNR